MTDKAGFYADVRGAIGRGTSNDDKFDAWGQQAISLIENAYTYKYMEVTREFPIVPATNSNIVDLSVQGPVKEIGWVKWGEVTGTGATATTLYGEPLAIVDPVDILSIDSGFAVAGYLSNDTIFLDARAQSNFTLFVNAYFYTDWAAADDADTPAILAKHYAAFKAKFMLVAAMNLRDSNLAGLWSAGSQEGVAGMMAADAVARYGGRRLRLGMRNATP